MSSPGATDFPLISARGVGLAEKIPISFNSAGQVASTGFAGGVGVGTGGGITGAGATAATSGGGASSQAGGESSAPAPGFFMHGGRGFWRDGGGGHLDRRVERAALPPLAEKPSRQNQRDHAPAPNANNKNQLRPPAAGCIAA